MILTAAKAAAKALVARFKKEAADFTPVPTYEKSTARQRKIARAARDRFVHQSTKLEYIPEELRALFDGSLAVRVGKGITYKSARGILRRRADALATTLHMSNKERRRLRSRMRAELDARMEQQS